MRDPYARFKFCLHRFAHTTEEAQEINRIVDREMERFMHEPTGDCLYVNRDHKGPHIVPPNHPVLKGEALYAAQR